MKNTKIVLLFLSLSIAAWIILTIVAFILAKLGQNAFVHLIFMVRPFVIMFAAFPLISFYMKNAKEPVTFSRAFKLAVICLVPLVPLIVLLESSNYIIVPDFAELKPQHYNFIVYRSILLTSVATLLGLGVIFPGQVRARFKKHHPDLFEKYKKVMSENPTKKGTVLKVITVVALVLAGVVGVIWYQIAGIRAETKRQESAYSRHLESIMGDVWKTAEDLCINNAPSDASLQKAGFAKNEEGVWFLENTLFSYGDGLTSGATHHCIITPLYPAGARPEVLKWASFRGSMRRFLGRQYEKSDTFKLEMQYKRLNAIFVLTQRENGAPIIDGTVIHPSPKILNEIGGLLINVHQPLQ